MPTTITILVAGKPKVGKSAVLNSLFSANRPLTREARSVITKVMTGKSNFGDNTVYWIDPPGLQNAAVEDWVIFKSIRSQIGVPEKFVLLYCISVMDAVTNTDYRIIQKINKNFGPKIWDTCILLLTNCDRSNPNNRVEYTRCLKDFAKEFEDLLTRSGVSLVKPITFEHFNNIDSSKSIVMVPTAMPDNNGYVNSNIFPEDTTTEWSNYMRKTIENKSDKYSPKSGHYPCVFIVIVITILMVIVTAIIGIVIASIFGNERGRAAGITAAVVGIFDSFFIGVALYIIYVKYMQNERGLSFNCCFSNS